MARKMKQVRELMTEDGLIIVIAITGAHHLDIVEEELVLAWEKGLTVHVGAARSLCYADAELIMKKLNKLAQHWPLVIINADYIQAHRVLYPLQKACKELEKQMKKKNKKNQPDYEDLRTAYDNAKINFCVTRDAMLGEKNAIEDIADYY